MFKFIKVLILFLCLSASIVDPVLTQSALTSEERLKLEQELGEIEKQIQVYEKTLGATQAQKETLQNKVNILKNRRAKIELQIKANLVALGYVEKDLERAEDQLEATLKKLADFRNYLAEALRLVAQTDTYSPVAKFLSAKSLFDFFLEINELQQIQANLGQSLDQYDALRRQLNQQTDNLNNQKENLANLLSIQKIQQQEVINAKAEQETILKDTKGRESAYQELIADSRRRANEIRSRIYELVGVPQQITFGEAVKLANWVASQIKIRPAFLLAVLTQESSLGKNVGTCNRPLDPPAKSWRVVMKPERDHEPFKEITRELVLDIEVTPVSCPMRDSRGRQVGWGGAMGPAQFIPSTWQGYKKEVASFTGQGQANPWDIRDSFVAAAILLSRNGANRGGEPSEWAAAMRYFSGSTNTRFRFYGDNVTSRAKQYEKDIADLSS